MSKPIPPEVAQRITGHVFSGNKIAAIKLYREHTGEGLKESKDFVESLEAELRAREPYRFTRTSEGKGLLNRLPLYACAVVAILLVVFLWHGKGGASMQRWYMTSPRGALVSPTADGARTPAVTKAPAPPTEQKVQPNGEDKSASTNVMSQANGQPAHPTDLSGSWHVMRPPKLDLKVTLTRIDDQHYKLTPASLALQGVYAWDGKTLSMESGNPAYRDLTWELAPSRQFVMIKGAYKGATMTRE